MHRLQRLRRTLQVGFFALFVLAPALNLLRFDLNDTQLWVLGQRWSLGIDAFKAGQISANRAAIQIFLRGFLPAIALIVGFLAVAWRYGRLYCGWLCPHFSLVEALNATLYRACGRFSVWEKRASSQAGRSPRAAWWPVFFSLCLGFGFLWAITLLTYLLPPAQIWGNLVHGTLTPNQARFIGIGTAVFTLEFTLARHLFCRFGCAVGLFQSLAWMANPRGMVVAFQRDKARDCRSCATAASPAGSACDKGCPMRLHPRNIKRMMFSCVQCGQCLDACDTSQQAQQRAPLLTWAVGEDAVRETLRQRREELARERPQARAAPSPPPTGAEAGQGRSSGPGLPAEGPEHCEGAACKVKETWGGPAFPCERPQGRAAPSPPPPAGAEAGQGRSSGPGLPAEGPEHCEGAACKVKETWGGPALSCERPQGRAAPSPPPTGVKETWGGPAFPCERTQHPPGERH